MRPKLLLIFLLIVAVPLYSQTLDSIINKIDPEKWSTDVSRKVARLEEKIIAKSEKTLRRLQKEEERIYRQQLFTKDSLLAKNKLAELQTRYTALREKLGDPSSIRPM